MENNPVDAIDENGVMMQFFHWYIPADGELWSELRREIEWLAKLGVTAVWLPPTYKGDQGGTDVGYAVYDMYDLGEFDQKGSVRTKYGTKDQLVAAVSKCKDFGVQVYADVVFNHRIGGDEDETFRATPVSNDNRHEVIGGPRDVRSFTKFTFPGRGGTHSEFQWNHQHFTAVDIDMNDRDYQAVFLIEGKTFDEAVDMEKGCFDYLMGCDVDVKHPDVQQELKDWGTWYLNEVGLDGVRFDAVKHIEAGFFPEWLKHVRDHAGRDIFAVGEYWSYDLGALKHFLHLTGGMVTLFDAPLHASFSRASKAEQDFDLRTIFDGSLVSQAPELAVTIVSNHDTQPLQALESVVEAWFKPLAYALILLRRDGYPCLFYADYYGASYTDKGRDGNEFTIKMTSHRFLIDQFLNVRRNFNHGQQFDYFDHPNTIGWTRSTPDGSLGMAVVLSNSEAGCKRMQLHMKNAKLRDVTGHVDDEVTTDGEGWGEFPCPARSLSLWVPAE
ncbi:alpha-amylase [Rubripirellula reticaptiva]|uniref:Alpha-amylase n=1 Tax=Rubripirellula reticaptiva TaxID=2528013 RepID=A0A5C6EFR1_9BACT|nr:alpha-amylase [Rubripirellula reticaptiva]TWU46531.1 Alpha-amylase precursor [Rubripirellula reticaptiva]